MSSFEINFTKKINDTLNALALALADVGRLKISGTRYRKFKTSKLS